MSLEIWDEIESKFLSRFVQVPPPTVLRKDAEPEDWIRELMVLADVNSRKKGGGGVADFQQQKKKVVDMAPERWKKEIDGVAFQANTKGIHGAAIDKIIEEVKKSEAKEASSVPSAALALQAGRTLGLKKLQ